MPHPLNFTSGWILVLTALLVGIPLGLGFHRDDFLGGYTSFRRRLLRLGHVALAALGTLNILFGLSPLPAGGGAAAWPGPLLLAGAITMPLVCFLAAWRAPFRHAFFLPVTLLGAGFVLIIVQCLR